MSNSGKKLSLMSAYYGNNEEYFTATKFYCCLCILEHFGRPIQVKKWDNEPCLACKKTLLNEGIKKTPIEATWRRAVKHLDSIMNKLSEIRK
ncbi:hypothetical protein G9A89_004335 [Geosiphon pyriformis]|nr:hypothetical protein G9A89_004335 [Geosiphon pyriformis]